MFRDMDIKVESTTMPSEHSVGTDSSSSVAEHPDRFDSKSKNKAALDYVHKPVNPKDPSRPRRKKARRACFACQRAHLTCGDERPCQRCIKRGLQDACHDGVRKKAKYLHDAPDGALMPGVGTNYYSGQSRNGAPLPRRSANIVDATKQNAGSGLYSTTQPDPYNAFRENSMNQNLFATQQPVSPTFMKTGLPIQPHGISPAAYQQSNTTQGRNPLTGPLFDPSDPALFNFDLSSMNFENRYGALEFSMLGHMATGAGDSPSDTATQQGSMGRSGSVQFSTTPIAGGQAFDDSPGAQQPFVFGDPLLNEWPAGQASGQAHVNIGGVYPQSTQGLFAGQVQKQEGPHAFAIESGPTSFTSPGPPTSTGNTASLDDNTFSTSIGKSNGVTANGQRPKISTPSLKHQSLQSGFKKRHRNPSSIYESVKEPYAYTNGFHNLTAFFQRRFSPQKTLQIAKSLASIRPSFIATTKTLNRDDLVFMEKCFQRTLWEYEDFINACGTPTIVCRRTGEIAAVGKEFSILTGWKKEVLLGKEPNLNVNTGGSGLSGSTSRGSFTPQNGESGPPGRPQPVFLAELLDDDSVVEFYEDFARLAFGDSRGSVMNTCKLLKYKTQEDMDLTQADNGQKWSNYLRKGGIAGEAGMNQLGFKDGKVECAYCWTVKRDVFDIPMLIVMNFLPCI